MVTDKSPLVPLRGSPTFPFTSGRMGFVAVQNATPAIVLPEPPDANSIAIKELFESRLTIDEMESLGQDLNKNEIALILSVSAPIASGTRENVESEIYTINRLLSFDKLVAEIEQAHKHGLWTVPFEEIALTLVPCDSFPVNGWTGYLPLEQKFEEIKQRIEEVQTARKVIDDLRDQWLHSQAEPLLNDVHELLKTSSLPSGFRSQLQELYETLRLDSYGYSDLIETQDIQTILNVRDRQARELSQKGELGIPFSRTYVHSRKEAENAATRIRKPGPSPKSE